MEGLEWLQYVADIESSTERPLSEKACLCATSTMENSQLPTPPNSTPRGERTEDIIVSVSTAFYPDADHPHVLGPTDLIVVSSDDVHFYVHVHHVLGVSENGFNFLLPPQPKDRIDGIGFMIKLPESSNVLNVILHTIYNMSCIAHSPSIDTIIEAVDTLPKYGIPVSSYIAPCSPLFLHILSLAPYSPIEMYALAGYHNLHDLAVPISSHLLGYQLSSVTDTLAARIGPVYLRKLLFLHMGRLDALKRLVMLPPRPHEAEVKCNPDDHRQLIRAWALATAHLVWDARPDLSASSISKVLSAPGENMTCSLCHDALQTRINEVIAKWSKIKTTI